jgi:hypothetical protein
MLMRIRVCLPTALLMALVLPAAAHAEGSPWGAPVTIASADSNTQLGAPLLAADAAGDESMAWEATSTDPQTGQSTYRIEAAYRKAGGSWGRPETIEGPESTYLSMSGSQLSMDSSGTAAIAYQAGTPEAPCGTAPIKLARRAANGGWSVQTTGFQGTFLDAVAGNAAGDIVIGWDVFCNQSGSDDEAYAAYYSPQSGWGPPDHLVGGNPADGTYEIHLAIDGAGDAQALLVPGASPGPGDWLNFQEHGGTWSAPEAISVPQNESNVKLAMSDGGRALAVCDYCVQPEGGRPPYAFGALESAPGRPLGNLDTVSAPDGQPWNPSLGFDSAGDATVVWTDNGSGSGIYTLDQLASASWAAPMTIPGSTGYGLQAIAENGAGNTAVLANLGVSKLVVFYRRAGGAFGGPEQLSFPSGSDGAYAPTLVMPGDGVPTAASQLQVASGQEIVAWDRQNLAAPSITEAPSGTTSDRTASFSFATADSGVKFQCRLDGLGSSGFSDCSSPQTYSGLSAGQHTFYVREADGNGNPGPASSQTWTVETNPPTTSIDSGPIGDTPDTDVTFGFSSTKPGSTFACSMDGGQLQPCGSPQTFGGLAMGPHTFEVVATDSVGNSDPTPATRAFTVVAPSGDTCPIGFARDSAGQSRGSCGLKCPSNSRVSVPAGPYLLMASAPSGCFRKLKGHWTSRGPLQVDGIPVTVPGGVTLSVGDRYLATSGEVHLALGPLQSVTVTLRWPIPSRSTYKLPLAGAGAGFSRLSKGALASKVLGGMKIKAQADLAFSSKNGGTTTLGFGLRLPTSLAAAGRTGKGAQLTVRGQLVLANGADPTVKLHASLSRVVVYKAFELDGLSVDYDSASAVLAAHGRLTLPGDRWVEMKLTFAGGALTSYSVEANPQLPIPPETCLTELKVAGNRAFGDTPASLELGGGLAFGLPVAVGCDLEPVRIQGSVKVDYAGSPLSPSTVTIHGTGALYALKVADLTATWDVAQHRLGLKGTLGLHLPAVSGTISIGTSPKDPATYSIMTGALDVWAEPSLQVHIPGVPSSLSATVHINNKGIVACSASGLGFSFPWGGGVASIKGYTSGCDLHALG